MTDTATPTDRWAREKQLERERRGNKAVFYVFTETELLSLLESGLKASGSPWLKQLGQQPNVRWIRLQPARNYALGPDRDWMATQLPAPVTLEVPQGYTVQVAVECNDMQWHGDEAVGAA